MLTRTSDLLVERYRSLRKRWKQIKRDRSLERAIAGKEISCKDIGRIALQCYVPVTQPLVLISEIQRSGGTLLSQLFDGHPECHAHPHELKIGYPAKNIWPEIDLTDDPDTWFRILFELPVMKLCRDGYRKGRQDETFLFAFLPSLQRDIFVDYLARREVQSHRDILDAYMTSFFNAWLNCQGIYEPKRIVTGFVAGLSTEQRNMSSFFEIYPDGRLITVIRNPHSWYASARKHRSKQKWFGKVESAIEHWKRSADAMSRNKEQYGDRVCIVKFDDLIADTERVMRHIAEFSGITYQESLLIPTFNRQPIGANTSFADTPTTGIVKEALTRKKELDRGDIEYIDATAMATYERVLAQAF